jgi:hypothetical protein
MRFLFGVLGLLFFSLVSAQSVNVLFLGNSYTASNQMTAIFEQLATSAGDQVYVDALNIGGYTLGMPGSGHLSNPASIELIQQGDWNFVVLQEQSQMPTIPYYRDNYTYPAADSLHQIIQESNPCANTVFFMTWGRKNGGQQCISSYCSPVFVDYFHMQDSLESAYMNMALNNNAFCAPVGRAWANSIANGDPIELFAADESHPSLAGSYLAACTFYATCFNKSPLGIEYTAGLSPDDAEYLQQVAQYTVMSDPSIWNIQHPDQVIASFTYELEGTLANFTNTSVNASGYHWDFGDPASGNQNNSSLLNPAHEYSVPGTYFVSLLAGNECLADEAFDTLVITETGIKNPEDYLVKVFPNPVRDVLSIQMDEDHHFLTYELSSLEGKKYLSGEMKAVNGLTQIAGMSMLAPGIYILVLKGEEKQIKRKIIISP